MESWKLVSVPPEYLGNTNTNNDSKVTKNKRMSGRLTNRAFVVCEKAASKVCARAKIVINKKKKNRVW